MGKIRSNGFQKKKKKFFELPLAIKSYYIGSVYNNVFRF